MNDRAAIAGAIGGLVLAVALASKAEATPGVIQLTDLTITPAEVFTGETVTITVVAINTGEAVGTKVIILKENDMAIEEKTVTLEPGESTTVTFQIVPAVADIYNVSVDGLSGSFVAYEPGAPDIKVEDLTITPVDPYVGETVSISVTATNYGSVAGSKTITCEVT